MDEQLKTNIFFYTVVIVVFIGGLGFGKAMDEQNIVRECNEFIIETINGNEQLKECMGIVEDNYTEWLPFEVTIEK